MRSSGGEDALRRSLQPQPQAYLTLKRGHLAVQVSKHAVKRAVKQRVGGCTGSACRPVRDLRGIAGVSTGF